MSAGSFAIMVHSLGKPEEVEAFLKDTLGKRIEALEAENAGLRHALRDIASRAEGHIFRILMDQIGK